MKPGLKESTVMPALSSTIRFVIAQQSFTQADIPIFKRCRGTAGLSRDTAVASHPQLTGSDGIHWQDSAHQDLAHGDWRLESLPWRCPPGCVLAGQPIAVMGRRSFRKGASIAREPHRQ